MKTLKLLAAFLLMSTTSILATSLSEYCETPSGHLGDADFGDRNGRISLTITKSGDTELSITVAPQDEDKFFDFISVTVLGGDTYTLGENENGDTLTDHTIIIPFDIAPEEVTFSSIQWSNVNSGAAGYWVVSSITVPFDAACDVDLNDDVAPVVTTATVAETTSTTITLNVAATDEDNDGADTGAITKFIVNDVANGIVDFEATVEEDGTITITDLTALTEYTFTITAKDGAGNISTEGLAVVVSTTDYSRVSEYCETYIGHFGADNAASDSFIYLTITNIDETSFKVTVEPSETTGNVLDQVSISIDGFSNVTLGSNLTSDTGYDALLGADEFTYTFTYASVENVPTYVTINSIMWSFTDWPGNWMLSNFTVPFLASCDAEEDDDDDDVVVVPEDTVSPIMVDAKAESITVSSAILVIEATDEDETGATVDVTTFILNDTANGIEDEEVTIDENGEVKLTGLTENTSYTIVITAVDAAGNVSENSKTVEFTTLEEDDDDDVVVVPEDTVSPVMVDASVADITASSATLIIEATDEDETGATVDVTTFILNDTANGIEDEEVTIDENGEVKLTGLTENTSYTIVITAVDAAGNVSENSKTVEFTTLEEDDDDDVVVVPEDTVSPVMVDASVADITASSATLIIEATDEDETGATVDVTTFILNDTANGIEDKEVTIDEDNEVVLSGLTENTSYTIVITAVDAAGNVSENSKTVEFTTLEDDGEVSVKESTTAENSVYGVNGTIYVKCAAPASVAIYTLTGSCVVSSNAVESAEYALPSGCYIVRIGDQAYKVVI